ncbi:MAG: signal peptidase II [Chitinophagaceae bacterium]|nr:signal peptidase II [Chitinophagaceae bacterium]
MNQKYTYLQIYTLVCILVLLDQSLKIWVKLHMFYREKIVFIENWFEFIFTENIGMAMGMKYGGDFGKVNLTCSRFILIIISIVMIQYLIRNYANKKIIIVMAFYLAGSIGNFIDNLLYAAVFSESIPHSYQIASILPKIQYSQLFFGKVVDMFYIPAIESMTIPEWFPFLANTKIPLFHYIFNLADTYITTGVVLLFVHTDILVRTVYKIMLKLRR